MDEFKMEQYAVCKSRRAKMARGKKKSVYSTVGCIKFFYMPVL